jgi:O-antigen/teichoic acid export membrane protein
VVDITRCEQCGKVIPAIDNGCAWCDAAEARRPGFREDDWLPLPIRMLTWLFGANLVVTGGFAVFTLIASVDADPDRTLVAVLASVRLLLSSATALALGMRQSWGRWLPFTFLAFEGLSFVALQAGLLPADRWIGGWIGPLWNLLFVFLFLRDDVRARLDRRIANRREVGELIETLQRHPRGEDRR